MFYMISQNYRPAYKLCIILEDWVEIQVCNVLTFCFDLYVFVALYMFILELQQVVSRLSLKEVISKILTDFCVHIWDHCNVLRIVP